MATKKMKSAAAKRPIAKKKGSMGVKVGVGVAAGVAAALAGAYLMYSKSAAPQRKQAKAWAAKARKDVACEVGKLKNVSASEYARIIDKAMQRYAAFKEVNGPEIAKTAKELKAEWKHIQAHAKKFGAKPTAKKSAAKKEEE
jgi:cytochrome c oxidase assembly factor CtaG